MTIQEIKTKFRPDSLLQGSIYAHCVTAFANEEYWQNPEKMLKNLQQIDNIEGEICCSWKTQPLGAVGAYVSGEVTLASNSDLSSYISEKGERDIRNINLHLKHLFSNREELVLTKHHCEFFVKKPKIKAIWMTADFEWAEEELANKIKQIAKEKKVKVFIIK